jgi:hypothetical protein
LGLAGWATNEALTFTGISVVCEGVLTVAEAGKDIRQEAATAVVNIKFLT